MASSRTQRQTFSEPAPRVAHKTIVIDGKLYIWAGLLKGPLVHDSPEKKAVVSSVDVFHLESGDWVQQLTIGTPLGVGGYACAAVGDELHYFGGSCGHSGHCYHNGVHKLSTSSLQWEMLSPTTSEDGRAPMKKAYCDMVAFKDGEEDILFVVGGLGTTPSSRQPGAQYEDVADVLVRCNEQHMFTLSTREWSSPNITGQPPPPCNFFTLTQVGEKRAALFGGQSVSGVLGDLFVVELSRRTVHWTKISNAVNRLMEWPERRSGHAATCVSGPLLVIMGGAISRDTMTSDCWIYDFTTMLWKKLPLPDSVTERVGHSLSTLQLSPHTVWLVVFGGQRSRSADLLSHTVIVELFQKGDDQWRVGRVMEGADLVMHHHQILSEGRRRGKIKAVPVSGLEGATPTLTLLRLKTMKETDGKPLRIIDTVAAGDYITFGMCLLQDENGEQVQLIKRDHITEGAKVITEAILQKWLTSGAPTRTYQHLIECLKQSELGTLAEQIAALINN